MQAPFWDNDKIAFVVITSVASLILILYLISDSLENLAKIRQAGKSPKEGEQ